MNLGRLSAGVVCLTAAGALGYVTHELRDYLTEVVLAGVKTVKAADLVASKPGTYHRVALTDCRVGDPVVVETGAFFEAWCPVYLPDETPGTATPRVLLLARRVGNKNDPAPLKGATSVKGTITNGLSRFAPPTPPAAFRQAVPKLDPQTAWVVEPNLPTETLGACAAAGGAGLLTLLGLGLTLAGLFGKRPVPKPKVVPDTRPLPTLVPLNERTSRFARREYVHTKCGFVASVSGDDLVRVECPFRGCAGTYCPGCAKHFPLGQFDWADTGENIDAYRGRLFRMVPVGRMVYLTLLGNAYEGAVNLGTDGTDRVIQPLIQPPPAGR